MASVKRRICFILVFSVNALMISAWSHKEYEMSSDQVCSRMGRRELPITFEHPALVRDGGRLFSDWPGIRKYDCRWKVEGKRDGKGVTAVVQKVRLRRASEKECTDYIQFKRESRVDRPPRICGSVLFGILLEQNDTFPPPNPYPETVLMESIDPKSDWMTLAAPGSIVDVDGEVLTYVHVAQKKLQLGERIELVIAYTAFQECREKVPEGSFHCGYGLCISSSLVKDGVINCPFADCIDEGSCQEARDSNVTKTILSKTVLERKGGPDPTTSTFVALFILAIICLAIYYLYRRNRQSRQRHGKPYGTVNGLAQQQALTGSGYIEIPGTATNQPYTGMEDPSMQEGLPYPLDPNQLQDLEGQYVIQPDLAMPGPSSLPPGATYYATQHPNPLASPTKGQDDTPPPIGFVVADVTPIPASQVTPVHLAQITVTEPSPVTPEKGTQGYPVGQDTPAQGIDAQGSPPGNEEGGPSQDAQAATGSAPPSMPPPPLPCVQEQSKPSAPPLQPPPVPPRDAQPSAPPLPTP